MLTFGTTSSDVAGVLDFLVAVMSYVLQQIVAVILNCSSSFCCRFTWCVSSLSVKKWICESSTFHIQTPNTMSFQFVDNLEVPIQVENTELSYARLIQSKLELLYYWLSDGNTVEYKYSMLILCILTSVLCLYDLVQ